MRAGMRIGCRGSKAAVGPLAKVVEIVDHASAELSIHGPRAVGSVLLERSAREAQIFPCLRGA